MFYDSVTKQVGNNFTNVSRIWLGSPRYSDEFNTMCNNVLGNNTAVNLRISHELVKCTPNAHTNDHILNKS